MPILRVNATRDGLKLHGTTQRLDHALTRAADAPGPVIVLIPGYSYEPGHPVHCPHERVLHASGRCVPSWPRGFGFGLGHADEGLALAFGWEARGSIWAARRRALSAGRSLADLIRILRHRAPHRPVHFVAHSMGVELAAETLHHLPAGAVTRIISMTGAAYRSRIVDALVSPAGQGVEFVNVMSRANAVFDRVYARLIAPPRRGDVTLGRGLAARNALDLQLDCAETLAALDRLGTPIGAPQRRMCHWSGYTRPGALACYNAWLRQPERFSLSALRAILPRPGSQPTPARRVISKRLANWALQGAVRSMARPG